VSRRFVLPGPDVGRLMLDRLIAEGVRYGRDFALVRISWEADELLALLPATGRPGAERAAERLRECVDLELGLGAAHWVGDTAYDLLARAEPRP
jgi:hypothetical protein